MGGKLTYDPGGGSEASLSLDASLTVTVDHDVEQPRQTMESGAYVQTRSLAVTPAVFGRLELLLQADEIATVRTWMAGLLAGEELRCFPDESAAAIYTDVLLNGERVDESYEYVGPGWWSLTLEVLEA